MKTQHTQDTCSVELKIPSRSEFVGVARLALSGVASRTPLTYEDIEDLKVALSEACNNAIQHAYPEENPEFSISIRFCILPDGLEVDVEDTGRGFSLEQAEKIKVDLERERGFGIFLIRSLVDDVTFESLAPSGTRVAMTKNYPKQ